MLVLIPLLLVAQLSLAQQGPFECHDPAMTDWMTNSRGQTPCRVLQDVMRICNPAYLLDWMPSNYICDNSPGSITAACCCGSPTFALFSACWSCQYNYTMEATSTTFTSFEKECAAIPNPLTDYDPIVKSRIDEIDIPLWARIEPSAGKWDLEGAWRNATPSAPTTVAPIPTSFPSPTQVTDSSSAGLSSGAIIGIIVGSVFGTAVMFILAAIILWRCLGFGRSQRRPEDDVRIGKDMGYLDGEYIYVPRNPEPRFSSQRESLRPLDLNASDVSREPSDYEYDPPRSRLSAHPSYRETWGEPPSPFSPARHASLDGKYRGYHPGATPLRESMDLPRRSSRYDDGYRPSRDLDGYRRSRDEHDGYRPNPPFRASRDQGSSYRPSRDQDPPYRMSRDYNPERDQGRRRPISGHFSHHRPSGSGDFVSRRPISGQYNGPGSRPGSRPVSGHFRQLSDLRTSTERKKEHRMSVRSGLRHGSIDSTRRSGDAGRFMRLEDREGGGRFSRDGWGRRSRDIAHKASLSEGDEDRESAEATGSKARPDYHQHLRQRSQSARVSHDAERELTPDEDENPRPQEPSTPTPHPATSTSSRSHTGLGIPTKPARNPLRVTNAQSDSDRGGSRSRRPITREPGLLARARTLINSRPSSSGRSSTNPPSSPAPGSPAPVPPSAWHQRLPKVLRSRPGSSQSHGNGPRSSTGSDHSDATSAYHTAQGHGSSVTELAQRTPDFGSRTSGLGELGHRISGQADSSYRQEVDAGVQIVVESSPDTPADPHASHPPAYIEQNSSTRHLLDPDLVHNRLSVLSRDTALSVGDSTVSVGELQTWEAARRPMGFVGTGRIITPPIDSARTSRDEGTMADASSTAVSTTELDMDEYDSADGKAMLGALGLSNSSQEASTIQHQ